MTKRELEKRFAAIALRLERRHHQFVEDPTGNWFANWIVRPDTIRPCMAREVKYYHTLRDAADGLDLAEIDRRDRGEFETVAWGR